MPIPPLTGLPPKAEFSDIVRKVNQLVNELVNTLLNLDSLNVVSLTADHIDAGTINGNVVTIRSDLNSGAYIVIDGSGMRINDGTQDVFVADTDGNVTTTGTIEALAGHIGGFTIENDRLSSDSGEGIIEGGSVIGATVTGGVVRSGNDTADRIEMSSGKFRGITSDGSITGLYFDIGTIPGTGLADIHLYHNNSQLLTFYDEISSYAIKPGTGASSIAIGETSKSTFGRGSWSFLGPVDFNSATITGLSTNSVGDHYHGIAPGTQLAVNGGGYVVWGGDGAHSHTVS